jgi:hypothetical protein
MAAIEDILKNQNFAVGAAIGLGAAILTPLLVPLFGRAMRPVAKAVIKAGIVAYEKGRENFAELGELVEDAVAEAHAEMNHSHPVGGMATGYGAGPAAAQAAAPYPARGEAAAPQPPADAQGNPNGGV